MKLIAYGSMWQWDEAEMVRAQAGRQMRGPFPSRENCEKAALMLRSIPYVRSVEVTAGDTWFEVAPAPEQPCNQLALAQLLGSVRNRWRVSNVKRRFDPRVALKVAKMHGLRPLRWRTTWIKVTAPARIRVDRALQRYPASVDNMIAALADAGRVIGIGTFCALSTQSITRAMPPDEAARYNRYQR